MCSIAVRTIYKKNTTLILLPLTYNFWTRIRKEGTEMCWNSQGGVGGTAVPWGYVAHDTQGSQLTWVATKCIARIRPTRAKLVRVIQTRHWCRSSLWWQETSKADALSILGTAGEERNDLVDFLSVWNVENIQMTSGDIPGSRLHRMKFWEQADDRWERERPYGKRTEKCLYGTTDGTINDKSRGTSYTEAHCVPDDRRVLPHGCNPGWDEIRGTLWLERILVRTSKLNGCQQKVVDV